MKITKMSDLAKNFAISILDIKICIRHYLNIMLKSPQNSIFDYFFNFQNILSDLPGLVGEENNPYLGGQKLPVAAKKGHF